MPFVETNEEGRLVPFDEMNTVNMPFALLTKQNSTLTRMNITNDGRRFLEAQEGLLPSALAERAVVALVTLHHELDPSFQSQTFRFSLRGYIENYLYRGRTYRPSNRESGSVVEQLNRVARTRLCTDNWYDRERGYTVKINASIIDYIKVDESSQPHQLEIGWGKEFWKSLRSKYTKMLDPALYEAIERPIDLRLYRWLDMQLARKSKQPVRSIQEFARAKLAMHSSQIDRGGRTASTYVARQLEKSIVRLNGIGFPVRLTIDKSAPDYRLTFSRLQSGPNEVESIDVVGDLLRHFGRTVHGATRVRRAVADQTAAQAWIDRYGVEASQWMTAKAAQLYKRRTGEKALSFRALELYADAAHGAWTQKQAEQAGQHSLPIRSREEDPLPTWNAYYAFMTERLSNAEQDRALAEEVESSLKAQVGPFWDGMGRSTRKKMLESLIKARTLEKHGLLSEKDYDALSSSASLDAELQRRHGLTLQRLATV